MYCMDNMDHLHQLVILCICLACIHAHFRTHVPRHTSTYVWKVPDVPIFETESGLAHMSMHMSVHKSMHIHTHVYPYVAGTGCLEIRVRRKGRVG